MKHFGLIGRDISHSLSPQIHRVIGQIFNLDLNYSLFDITPEELPVMIEKLRSGVYHGFNVTMPYKSQIIQYLDTITSNAKRIGAINTVYLKDNLVIGDNTDYYGFKEQLLSLKIDFSNKEVYILGTGGAAKAAYVCLEDLGAVPICVRRAADQVSELFKNVIYYEQMRDDVSIIVNATPVGMAPHVNKSVLPSNKVKDKIVFDFIYNPKTTLLMSYAKEAYNGLLILFVQAFYSESLFFDKQLTFENKYLTKLEEAIKR